MTISRENILANREFLSRNRENFLKYLCSRAAIQSVRALPILIGKRAVSIARALAPPRLSHVRIAADIVEEVGGLTVRDGARRQARVSSFVLRQALGLASGSALPAFEGSERWQRGGTRLEHQTDLSA